MATTSNATLSVSLVRVPITAAAKAADPTLNTNSRSYDLKVTQTGEKWNVGVLQGTLGSSAVLSGSLYAPTGHSDTKLATPPTANLAFDTALTTPQFNAQVNNSQGNPPSVAIAGHADYPANPGPGNPATSAAVMPTTGGTNKNINVVWGDSQGGLATQPDGTYTIARLTVQGNTGAYLSGYVLGTVSSTPVIFTNLYLPILGDINADGVVNQTDLNQVTQNFLSTSAPQADFNDDGVVNQTDLNAITQDFLNTLSPPPGGALGSLVPEPSCLAVLLGGMVLAKRRQRG